MKLRRRYFLLITLALLPFYKLIHFSDYCFGDVDLLAIVALSVVFAITFITIVFYNLYKISLKKELFNFRPLIIAGVFSLTMYYGIEYHNKNVFKDKVDIFKSMSEGNKELEIVLFDDDTFEFKTTFNKNTCVEKGTYYYKNDLLFLNKNNKATEKSNFDSVYVFNKTYHSLKPEDNSLPIFTLKK